MTAGADLAEIVGHVIWIGRGGEIGLMTGVTGGTACSHIPAEWHEMQVSDVWAPVKAKGVVL